MASPPARSAQARSGRSKRWILPAVVVLLWLFIGGPLGSFAGKLASVQENDNASFLPQSAESTVVQDEFTKFVGDESFPTTVVFERDGGLTASDLDVIAGYVDEFKGIENIDVEGVRGPILSEDRVAAQVLAPIASSDGDELEAAVVDLRETVQDPPEGLTALVGGPGGVLADFIEVFSGIDGVLLGVALAVVLLILLAVYRSPILPFVVLFSSVLALGVASAAVYFLADNDILDLNGQSQGILFILAVGAATDYSLLIVARFREELRDHESKYDAMRRAYRGAFEPIVASGATVILALLCLLLADLSSLRGLGPVGALGVAGAVLAALTLLPSALVLLGRKAYWPIEPAFGSEHRDAKGIWGRVARLVGRRARLLWVATAVILAVAAGFVSTLNEDPVPQTELFLTQTDSADAQEILDANFEADRSSPVIMVVPEDDVQQAMETAQAHEGVAANGVTYLPDTEQAGQAAPGQQGGPPPPRIVDGEAIVLVTLDEAADSAGATQTVRELRVDMDEVSQDIVLGGQTAIQLDTRDTIDADRLKVIPAILIVIFLVLAALLRSLLAPFLLIVANVLSFGATMGISAVLFNHVFDFPTSDPGTFLISFVFLVALGIDYSIFLMTRVREESIRQGTHPGILKGLSVTGGVITSAGVVLAATFAALGVLPLLFLAQIAFVVAFGVLLDTIVVRSLLVPALSYDLGPLVWWPSRLWHTPDHADRETAEMLHLGQADGIRGYREDVSSTAGPAAGPAAGPEVGPEEPGAVDSGSGDRRG